MAWDADKVRTALIVAATTCSGVLAAFGLLATQRVLIELFAGGPTPDRVRAALPALAWLAAVTMIRGGLGLAVGYALNGLTPRVHLAVERELFENTTGVELRAFDDDGFAEGMERATRGTEAAIELVQNTMNLFAGVVSLLAVIVAVVTIHPLLLAALLVATVSTGYAALRAGHVRFQSYLASSTRRRRQWVLQRLMADRKSAAELRSYGLRGFLLRLYDQVMGAQIGEELRVAQRVTATTSIGAAIGGIALAGVYVLLGMLLVDGEIPLAAAATCVIAVQAAQRALAQVTFQVDRVFSSGQFFNEYIRFLASSAAFLPGKPKPDDADIRPAPDGLTELSLSGVCFHYPDRDRPAVGAVTLTIHAGQTIALVGENGSGKSTLAAMISGLREPTSGELRWNSRPYASWDTDGLRRHIAVAVQDHHQWPFSAATNIAMGDIDTPADSARIEAAACEAAAHDMITELPHGYDTLLDRTFKEGQDLSGGQWQRIAAARAFLRNAPLLIMDEPSSALDPRAEDALFQALRSRQGTKTTILITHRLANITHADQIFVLEHGVVIEAGTHHELMALAGLYQQLFSLQAAGYAANAAASSMSSSLMPPCRAGVTWLDTSASASTSATQRPERQRHRKWAATRRSADAGISPGEASSAESSYQANGANFLCTALRFSAPVGPARRSWLTSWGISSVYR
ncbi:multidrug ABC transporter permease [Actinoplanes cyaneus]|uniref:Multidrug ABC transporter permease n=1 Tax=Actinoplanes cyaneus TaxID=52696 RepID=A0A919IJD8_9ACTN|nr:ATP-binding cassette, subfamily B [Actinoplanes cyaneus]GID66849.1 multidrug ABC transporter permease [Actinoplanes cyaneus]